jgi:hypothetical protein
MSPRLVEVTAPEFGELFVNSDGTITYSPWQIPLPSGYERADIVQYTASPDGTSMYTGTITLWTHQVNDSPVAFAANHTIKENTVSTFQLDAFDEDNDSLTYTLISSTEYGNCELDPNSGELVYSPLFEFSGKETLTFQASDGLSSSDIMQVVVTVLEVGGESVPPDGYHDDEDPEPEEEDQGSSASVETGPTADAGFDSDVLTQDQVTLDGSDSYDADGDEITYSWSQLSGPEVSLAANDTATPTFLAPTVTSDTDITFELTVSDVNSTDSNTVTVTVLPILIDPIPNTYPNNIYLDEPDAEIPVAIIGSTVLFPGIVDEESLRLGPNSAAAARFDVSDFNNDGFEDHMSYYRTGDLGLKSGDKKFCFSGAIETENNAIVNFNICKNIKVIV